MAKRKSLTKEDLKELCRAHSQVVQAQKDHLSQQDVSTIVQEMYEQKIKEVESRITEDLKSWLGVS